MADIGSRLRSYLGRAGFGPSRNGVAHSKADPAELEKKFDFVGDLSAGRVVYTTGGIPGEVEKVNRATAYAAALYLFVAVRYRAENIAEPPLRVVEATEDGEEPVLGHPLNELLEDPSPDFDMGEIVELAQTYWDIDGDALLVKDASLLGTTARLQPFGGREYEVKQTLDRLRGRFELKTSSGMKPKAPEDVVYLAYPNPSNRQRGLSPTDVALSWLNLGVQTTATIRNLLSNAVFPSVVISPHHEWHPDDDEYEQFKAAVDQYHGGPANAGKPFISLGGGKVTSVSATLKDLLPEELLDRIEACVGAAFRIPPVVLGYLVGLKNSPWSNMLQAHSQAYSDSIYPQWRRWEKALTRQLLRPVDPNPLRRLAFDTSAVRALQEDESKKVKDAARATFWTLNQRLIHTGRDPLPDGDPRGDWIEVVDGGAGAEPAASTPDPAKVSAGDLSTKAAPYDRSWLTARFDLMTKAQESTWEGACLKQLRIDRAGFVKGLDTPEFRDAWAEALEDEGKARVDELETKAPPTGDRKRIAALVELLAKRLDMGKGWTDRVTPLIESTGRTALKELAADLALTFSVLEPTLLEYTRTEAAFLVKSIESTTRDRIAAELKAGLAEGESIPDLTKRIQDATAFNRERAELIAITETTRVTNGAARTSMSAYQAENGDQIVEKSWLSARDGVVRPEHVALDKKGAEDGWIGIDETYANGLTEPSEPRCRCSNTYRIREAA